MDPVDEGWSHQNWVVEILTKKRICRQNDLPFRLLAVSLYLYLLFLDLKYIFEEVVIIFYIWCRKFDLVFFLHVFSNFDNPSSSFARSNILTYANVDVEAKSFEYTI